MGARPLDYLAEQRIPLETCPISNLRTGVVPTAQQHPVRRYFERGLVVTISSDDPKMFGTSLADEYRLLEEKLGFTPQEVCTLILQGIRSAWLPQERKSQLIMEFQQHPTWIRTGSQQA